MTKWELRKLIRSRRKDIGDPWSRRCLGVCCPLGAATRSVDPGSTPNPWAHIASDLLDAPRDFCEGIAYGWDKGMSGIRFEGDFAEGVRYARRMKRTMKKGTP